MIIAVVERDYSVTDRDFRDRYVGFPCHSFDEARKLCIARLYGHNELHIVGYIDNGTHYAEIYPKTGEVVKEFFVRVVG